MYNLNRIKILFVDHESGHGGSSKSLFNKIKLISKKNYDISVILKKKSYLEKKYKSINVKVYYLDIPTLTSLSSSISNIISYCRFIYNFIIFNIKKKNFYSYLQDYDYIHLNHENLFWLLKFIKIYSKNLKVSVSIRTILKKNFFSNIQINTINEYANKKMFISKKNLLEFNKQTKKKKKNNFVIENFDLSKQPTDNFLKLKSFKRKFDIVSLSNYSKDRGIDRIIDVAEKLRVEKFDDIVFNILGDFKISSLKNIFKKREEYDLKFLVKKKKLKNVKVLGHKSNIKPFLSKNNILLYLPRNDSAWGRNIIEALNYGLPVITLGKTNNLIVNDKNGFFLKRYDLNKVLKIIIKIHTDRKKLYSMSILSKKISKKKVQEKKLVNDLINFFSY